jgi:hypothetical protein
MTKVDLRLKFSTSGCSCIFVDWRRFCAYFGSKNIDSTSEKVDFPLQFGAAGMTKRGREQECSHMF